MVRNTKDMSFIVRSGERGHLVAVEEYDSVPFAIRRVYYIYGVGSDDRRGFHSHEALEQALICVSGSVSILVDDGERSEVVKLADPSHALYIGPLVWREMFDFSADAVLLVLASEHYDPDDYLHDYNEFKKLALSARCAEEG